MKITRLLRIALNTADLPTAVAFYTTVLGFHPDGPEHPATLFPGRARLLRRAHQRIELTRPDHPGAPYPADTPANAPWFQHCALVTDDIAALHAHVAAHPGVRPISRSGPVTLPGGIVAWKFRAPEGHPLELIQFPAPDPATRNGIDHSAITVADPARSLAFYHDLGLAESARQLNQGPGQDALDDLPDTRVDVLALTPPRPAPHLELLAYRHPRPGPATTLPPTDLAATRLVFQATIPHPQSITDPDGHHLLLEPDRPVSP